jgi:hypothetical protein
MSIELKAGATEIVPVYICHGAEHDFKIAAAEDSPWVNQGISLNLAPGDSSSVVTEPTLGEYQKFLPDGGHWKLICPAEGTDVDFNLQLQSEFTAQPYKVLFRLGDFRRKFLHVRPPIGAPVVGDKVVAEVQIGSFYTKKELENVEVEWMYDWKPVDRVPTSDSGWSRFEYDVLTAGEHQIMASVHSPYDDRPSPFIFPINVYLESPWEQASLFINGERVAWNSPSVVLFRGQPNEVRIEAPFLQEKEISLGLNNQDGLSIEAAPAFEEWVPVPDGTTGWVVTPAGNKSGRITLKLSSKETAQAWEVPCAVLSLSLADEADVLVDGVEVPPTGNWFIRDKPQTVTLTPKSGSPLAGLPVSLSCVIKSGLDIANVVSTPAFGSEQFTYSWVVTGKTKSGTFQLALAGKGMTTPINVTASKLLSTNLADEVEVKIGGESVPADGNVFFRGQARDVELIPKLGSPIAGHPIALTRTVTSPLQPSDLGSAPPFDPFQTTHKWRVTGANRSGTFQLHMTAQGMTTPINVTANKLLSTNLADEADVKIDNKDTSEAGTAFLRKMRRNIKLVPKPNSPLAGLAFIMRHEVLSKLLPGAVESVPAIGAETSNLEWDVGCIAAGDGAFRLELYCPRLDSSVYIECKQIDVSYNVAGKNVEMIDGVGEATIGDWGKHIFLVNASPEMVGDTVEIEGGGFLTVEPGLPASYIVGPGSMVWRMDVAKNIYSWSSEFLFRFSGVGDHVDVVNVHINESANQV